MKQELTPKELTSKEEAPMSEALFTKTMKDAIKQLKMRHEYAKLEAEILVFEVNRLKALEMLSQMQPKGDEAPQEKVADPAEIPPMLTQAPTELKLSKGKKTK